MRRLYSHYTFIYPDIYLKNCVVELDHMNRILRYFPFTEEIAKTEFFSGLLSFIPENIIDSHPVVLNTELHKEIKSDVWMKFPEVYKIVYND